MIHATIPRQRKQWDWKELIKSKEDYEKWLASGVYWVYFEDADEEIKELVFGSKEEE